MPDLYDEDVERISIVENICLETFKSFNFQEFRTPIVENKSLLEGIASSLTEIYAPAIHQERIAGLSKHYDWADDYALAYFKKRINQARRDVEFGREWVIENAISRSDQEAV